MNNLSFVGQADEKVLKTGTTTVGIVCEDGVVVASDKRATMGFFIASKNFQKIYPITKRIVMTTAGSAGDAQSLARLLTVQLKLFSMENGKEPSVNATATFLANLLVAHKFYPYFVQLLVGGIDEKGNHLFSIDMLGGVSEEKVASTGSGSPIAYGVLEQGYSENMKIVDGQKLAAKAVAAAMRRDAASGEHVEVWTVTKKGASMLSREQVEKLLVK